MDSGQYLTSVNTEDASYYDYGEGAYDSYGYEEAFVEEVYVNDLPEEVVGSSTVTADEAQDKDVSTESSDASRKLVKTVSMELETYNFDSFIKELGSKAEEVGGYIEFISVGSENYHEYYYDINQNESKYASANIRIPSAKLDEFLDNTTADANVVSKSESATDVTLQYADTQAKVESYKVERDRLTQLISEAQDIDTIIALESRLSEVRYQLESYESQLRIMQNQVDYSTVNLTIREVERYTAPVQKSATDRIKTGFDESMYNVKNGFKEFFVEFLIHLPYIVTAILIICVILFIILIYVYFEESRIVKRSNKEKRILSDENMINNTMTIGTHGAGKSFYAYSNLSPEEKELLKKSNSAESDGDDRK